MIYFILQAIILILANSLTSSNPPIQASLHNDRAIPSHTTYLLNGKIYNYAYQPLAGKVFGASAKTLGIYNLKTPIKVQFTTNGQLKLSGINYALHAFQLGNSSGDIIFDRDQEWSNLHEQITKYIFTRIRNFRWKSALVVGLYDFRQIELLELVLYTKPLTFITNIVSITQWLLTQNKVFNGRYKSTPETERVSGFAPVEVEFRSNGIIIITGSNRNINYYTQVFLNDRGVGNTFLLKNNLAWVSEAIDTDSKMFRRDFFYIEQLSRSTSYKWLDAQRVLFFDELKKPTIELMGVVN